MTETPTHAPLIVGNGGYAHGAEFEIRTADASDRYVTGITWADVNAPESGTMLTYGEAHDMAHRIVHAVNSHHRLVEALEDAHKAIAEYHRYWTGGETRGSYDGKPERDGMWKAMYASREALKEAGR